MQTQHLSTVETLFSMNGRIKRSTFWLWSLLIGVISGIVGLIDKTSDGSINVLFIGAVILLWPSIALGVKRCHDRNRSGFFVLLGIIPFINFWYIFDIGFLQGTSGENRYGPEPISAPAQELAGGSGTSPLNLKAFLFGTLKFFSALAIVAALSWAFWIYRQDVETKKWMKQQELKNQKEEALSVPKEWPLDEGYAGGVSFALKTKWQDNELYYQVTVYNPSWEMDQAFMSEREHASYADDVKSRGPRFAVQFFGSDGFTLLKIPIPFADMKQVSEPSKIGSESSKNPFYNKQTDGLQAEGRWPIEADDYTKLASWKILIALPDNDSKK